MWKFVYAVVNRLLESEQIICSCKGNLLPFRWENITNRDSGELEQNKNSPYIYEF